MFEPNLKRNFNMRKSIIILVFVVVLSQLGNASSTIENVSSITGKNELPDSDIQANTINLEDDAEKNKKPVVLLVPVESSEEIYDSHDEEGEEEEETTEEVEDVTHHNHKTKRCKSPNSFRSARRIPLVKDSRKYISASTESSIDESVETPIGGTSLFRVASVKDAKKILKNLLKSRSQKQEEDSSLERVSKPHNQNSNRQGHKPKKYVCYCVEEDCGMKRPGKKPSRAYAVKKRIGPNVLGKSSTNYEDQDLRGVLHSGDVVGAPNNLRCPPGAILMEEPEYLAQLAIKREKQNLRNRPVKNCPETIYPPDSEAYSLGQPTKIHIPLAGNRKWNRRIYKVDKKSPFAQKLQSVFEQREAQERIPCPEPETTYNDPQSLQGYYNNEENNYNPYNQIPVAPNLVYPAPYVVYPQYPQYPQYGDGLHSPIAVEPPGQDYVGHEEPSQGQYMPTPLGRNFIDINQCIKIFGPNFCIVTTTTISPIPGPHYSSNCGEEHEEPRMLDQWQDDTYYTTQMPQEKTSKYPTNAYKAEATTYVHGLGVTRHPEENLPRGEEYPEDDSQHQYGSRISSGNEYNHVTASPYGSWQTPNYENIGSKHEEQDYGDYENFVDPESPIRHDHTNSEYLIPIEDSDDSESPDYLGSYEETNENNVLQKMAEGKVTEGPVVAVTKNVQGAHGISSPQYVQYTVKPGEGVTTSSSEVTSDETFEDTSEYIQATQDSRMFDYDKSESQYSTSQSSNEESAESSTEFPSHSVFSTIDRPEDESRTTLLERQGKNKLPGWQRVTTMYPIIGDEDQTTSNHPGAKFEAHIPKTTNSHRQFVGITQTTPFNHYSEPNIVSTTNFDGNTYYSSSHVADDEAEHATTYLVTANEPQEPYTSATYSRINDAEEMTTNEDRLQETEEDEENSNKKVPTNLHYTTESRLGNTVNKYSTTKSHASFQSKQPKSNSGPVAGQITTSYENLVGKSQSTPMDYSAKPGFVSGMTVDGDNQYTTSYATMADSKYGTTSLLRANEPEEHEFSSTIYPDTDAEEMGRDSSGYEETSVETPSLYTSQSKNGDKKKGKYFTTEKTFYPQGGSYQTTFFDSSTQPERVGDSFESIKISSHQPFVESKTPFASSNSFEEPEEVSNEATSYATIENSEYDTTPLLRENEPEDNIFTSHLPYSTTVIDENGPASFQQQVTEENDEVSTQKIPSTVHYTTDSEMEGMDQNKWTKAEVTNSHRQFVVITQSTPVNDFSQSAEASSATISDTNYYTNSLATMKDTDNSVTSVLGAEEPEEGVLSTTNYSWPQENEEKHHDNIEQTTWTQYYPTQSEIQETGQHFTTDRYSHPQFVGSHQSTLVDSSTRQNHLRENFEAHKTSTYHPFVESISQSTTLKDFAKTEDISDAEISYATMANSKYDTTPSSEVTEPEEREFSSYSDYPITIETEGDKHHEPEEHDEDGTEKIPSSDYYTTQSKISDTDPNKWSKVGTTTSSHRQYVGVTHSTPTDELLQPEETSTATYGDNNYYTTSYARIEPVDHSTTAVLGDKEPVEEVFRSTTYPTIQGKHEDDLEETTWNQYYPTQSEMQKTIMDQPLTTDKNSYPQFVGLHQSTLVDDSTPPDQLSENFETRKTSLHQTFVGKTPQSTDFNDFATSNDISGTTTSYASMQSSKYEATPLLGETEPEEREFTSYAPYQTTIGTEGDTITEISSDKNPTSMYYTTKSEIMDMDKNKWPMSGKSTSSHRHFIGITTSKPLSDFTKSYTIPNSRYDTTPLLGATEPEEQGFTSYSPHSTTIEHEGDTTVSSWLQNTKQQNEMSTEKIPSNYYTTHSVIPGMDLNKWTKSGKATSSHPQFVGVTQSSPVDDFSKFDVASSSAIDDNSHYTTSYATMENSEYDTTPLLGATEPEEQDFTSYSSYSTTMEPEADTTASSWLQNTEERVGGKVTSFHPQYSGVTQSTPVDNFSKFDVASSSAIGGNSHYTTSYATMQNSEYNTTPLLGATEPEEQDFTSYSSPGMNQNKWTKSGEATSSYPQFEGITQSTPVDDFTQADLASRSSIGGNSHYTTSYATMENSKYDTTPLLGATEPEEQDFTSYSPYPTTIESEGDTTASSWVQNTSQQNKISTEKIPLTYYTTHSAMDQNKWTQSGKTSTHGSYPQFVGVTQSTPVDDYSQSGVASSATIGSNSHYTTSYATVEDMDHSTTSALGAKEPEEEIFHSTTYPTIHDAEEMKTTSSWQQENTHNYQNNPEETRWTPYYPSRSEVRDKSLGQQITTEKNSYPQIVKSQQPKHDFGSSTDFSTQQYFTTERNSHPQFSTEAPEDITLGNTNEQSTNWYYSTAQRKATTQSANRQFVASHHSTTSPRFKPDSGIKEETNAYFTSKAYDDNIASVTGPDSYFEGEGLKNWNDFTSMSSDDFTVGDTNAAEGVKQTTTIDSFGPKKEKWMTTEVSPRQFTDYDVVGEEMPYKESTINDEFSQETTEDDFSSRQTTQKIYGNTHTLYPEEVGKPIYESDSSTPIVDTHFFETHSMNPKILQSENKILESTSRGNLGIDYPISSEKSRFSNGRITQPGFTKIPFLDQSTTAYERVGDTLNDITTPENEADKTPLIFYGSTSPSEAYDYTDEYSTLEKSPTTEISKYQDDASLQPLGNTLRNEPSLNQEVKASSINYDDYMSSEDDLPSGSSESVSPNSKTASDLLKSSTTTRSVNYEDYEDCGSTQEGEWYPNSSEEQTTPSFDTSDEISSEDQLSPEDRNMLRNTVEKVVKDLISVKSDKPDKDGHTSPEVVGAPLLPGLPELPILKNLFSLPEVRNMAIGTVKGLMSEVSGVPQASSLGRLANHLIDSVLDGVVNNILPGPVTTTSSEIVDEHRYENGKWTVVPVTLIPKADRVGQKHEDKVSGTTKDVVGQKPDDKVLSTIKDIVGRPGIGLQGARLPLVQNIIVRAVENTLRNAKHVVNHSVIWDTLNDVIARAEKSLIPTRGTTTTVKTTTASKVKTTSNSNMKMTTKSSGVKTPGGPYKIAPIIPVTEHVFKDGKWAEKQTVLGAKRKNFESTTLDNQPSTSSSSYETSAEPVDQYDYTTKDYALLGESEEDDGTREYDTTDIVGITKEIPKNINTHHDDEEDLDNSPIKYYSPNDRILSYIKNHQTTAGAVGSQEKWQTTSGSLNTASTADYSTVNSVEFAQATPTDVFGFSGESTESSVDSSEESTICTCAEKKKMKNKEKVASALRGSTEASTEEDNYPELTSTIYDSEEPEKSNSRNHEEGNPLTTLQSPINSGEELVSTESSEFSSTIHHLDVDQDGSNDYTTEEYVANENPAVTEELDRNIAEDSQRNSEETSYITTDNIEPTSISSMEKHTKNVNHQITTSPVYVYGEPVGNTQFPEGTSRSNEQNSESVDQEELIGEANAITTENIDKTSDDVQTKIMDLNETPTFSDVTEENLGAENDKHMDQSITTPVYVYGTPVHEMSPQEATNSDENTDRIEPTSISSVEEHTKNVNHQITSTPVYVYGETVGSTEFPVGTLRINEENAESVDEELIGEANAITTENIDQTSEDVEASDKITDLNQTPTAFDVTEENLGAENGKHFDQSITTPVYVYGTPVHGMSQQGATNSDESTTQNLHKQFLETSEHHDFSDDTTASVFAGSQENIGNTQFPGHLDTGSDGQPDEYIKMENTLTPDNTDEKFEGQVSTEAFSDFTSQVLQADSKNVDNDFSTRVYVNGEPIQETTAQTLPRKLPKTMKSYISGQEATTSSQGLIGAAKSRNGRPRLPSLPRERLNRPRGDILKGSRPASGSGSNCMTPKYDPTYFGKISLNGVNPGGESISDLTNTDLFYVGDGVKIPLTIQRMPDGSYALSISEKICENFVKRKCPCCVPREGDIVEERRQSNEAEEYSAETTSREDYNYDSFEPTESAEFHGKSKKRYVRSTSGSEIVVTSATPVKNFVKKYNLSLDLNTNHLPTKIQRDDEDPEEARNTRRKTRLSSSRDAKLRNLYGNNNEIQRDDSEEVANRIVDDSDSDTVSKESNSIRKAEFVFDTDTDDLIQSLLHIKDAPEDKRTEIVLNALDGLVNAGENPDSMGGYTFGDADQEIPAEDQNPWLGSDEDDLNEMENAMARYGYQKDNPILERIRFIKAQQKSHGQYKYQKNIDHRAKGKMNMLKTVVHWLRQVFLETNPNNKS